MKKKYSTIIFTITLLMIAPFGESRLFAQNCQWAKSAGGNGFDNGTSVATDASGNVYVTCDFYSDTITFGSDTLTNKGGNDIFIVKYDAIGNVLWAKSAGGINNDNCNSVSTDASGNVYISGYFKSPIINFGSTILTNAVNTGSTKDFFITKYDASGNVLWAKSGGGTSHDIASSVSTDASGNIYISGAFGSPTITFGSITLTNAGSADIFIAKFDASGNVLWAKSVGGTGGEEIIDSSTDANGNLYVTGGFGSTPITFGSTTLTNAASGDIFIVKYDAAGNVLWAKSAGGSTADYGYGVSNDASGNVYITGNFKSPTITFGSTTLTNPNSTGYFSDIFIAKYDSAGNVLWAKSAGGTDSDYGQSVCCDLIGNVYLTGSFSGSAITFDTSTLTNNLSTNNNFIVKYTSNGTVLWAVSAGGTFIVDEGRRIATDPSSNLLATGFFFDPTISFGSTILNNVGDADMFIAKYSNQTPCSAFYTLFPDSALQSYWYLVNQCMGSDSLSADSLSYVWQWGDSANSTSTGAYPSFTYNAAGNYTICVTITDSSTGCTNTYCDSSAYISRSSNQMITVSVIPANSPLITGISASSISKSNEVGLIPNPTSSTLTLTIPKPINTNIIITNLTGKQVATYNLQNSTTRTIDVSNLAEGVYFVTLKSDEGVVTKKFIKQ